MDVVQGDVAAVQVDDRVGQAPSATPRIFSVGHSTLPLDRFLAMLAEHGIEALADVRRFPGSRRHPYFNRENLQAALRHAGIDYRWFEALGGRRSSAKDEPSLNEGLRHAAFRAYADYMADPAFRAAIDELLRWAGGRPTAMMCAEALFWRCHRRLISDHLLSRGVVVGHLFESGPVRPHALTDGAVVVEPGTVQYPKPASGRAGRTGSGEPGLFPAD